MKKYKLRKWVKVVLNLLAGALIGIAIYQLFTVETVKTTPVGDYTCNGGMIKICTGSEAVADYLGV
jgi:hypothetical protein